MSTVIYSTRGRIIIESVCETRKIKDVLEQAVREGKDLAGADLSNLDLSGAKLDHAMLIGADLTNSILIGASLKEARLMKASLMNADLTDSNLYGASFAEANLQGAILVRANLNGDYAGSTNLMSTNLCFTKLEGASMNGYTFLREASFVGAELTGLNGYSSSVEIFEALIAGHGVRGKALEVFSQTGASDDELAVVGYIKVHGLRWQGISERFGKKALSLFERLAEKEFGEYLERYQQELLGK